MGPKNDSRSEHPLLVALRRVDRPGEVCVSRDLPVVLPGLEVDGLGPVSFPLTAVQALALIKRCAQAPYGKGTQTLVDRDVRRVWELEPERFSLTNPRWQTFVEELTTEARAGLGLQECRLTPHLYRLLVYEKGSFFLPHRDGEKLDGMVATLVIALPSPHTGGELIVTHEGRQWELRFGGAAAGHELSYAAFYADCAHEVTPVRSGYRVCLVYNLVLANKRGRKSIEAPRNHRATAAVADYLAKWPVASRKLAVALDHQYSKEGLSLDLLKGIDRPRAEVLFAAAEQADCVAHLALITRWQSGSAEGGDYDYGYGYRRAYNSRRRYGDWSDDDDDEHDEDDREGQTALSGYSMGDVYDERLTIDCWLDRAGDRVPLGSLSIDEESIIGAGDIDAWTIAREEFEGYTGNAGMTLERWYHRAAVVIWPIRHHFRVLCEAGPEAAVRTLKSMVAGWKRAEKEERVARRQLCQQFARAILDSWTPLYSAWRRDEPAAPSLLPKLLLDLDCPRLIRRLLLRVMPRDGDVQLPARFAAFARKHGWSNFAPALRELMRQSTHGTFARNLAMLEALCSERAKDGEKLALCRELAAQAVSTLERLDSLQPAYGRGERPLEHGRLLATLLTSIAVVGASASAETLVDYVLAADYDLTAVHLAALFAFQERLSRGKEPAVLAPAVRRWLAYCSAELERRTASAPSRPRDFRRPCAIKCKCPDCEQLKRFMDDPHQSVLRMPLAQQRRQHLHQQIDADKCDLTHVTTRKGRPYVLVCTKTEASHEAACQEYERDRENLAKLRGFAAGEGVVKRKR